MAIVEERTQLPHPKLEKLWQGCYSGEGCDSWASARQWGFMREAVRHRCCLLFPGA